MKSKQFIAGVVLGAVVTSGVSVFATGDLISAIKTDDTKIFVDGDEIELEEGYEILNYNGRVYTSTRAVAEALDATVNYEVEGNNKNVLITSKPIDRTNVDTITPVVDPIVKEPEVDPTPVTPSIDYRIPPVKGTGLGVSVLVTDANVPIDLTEIQLEVTNNNTEGTVIFDYSKFRLVDEKDKVYYVKQELTSDATMFLNSIPNTADDEKETLKFDKLPAGTNVVLYMPLTRYDVSGNAEKYEIQMPLKIEKYDTTTAN